MDNKQKIRFLKQYLDLKQELEETELLELLIEELEEEIEDEELELTEELDEEIELEELELLEELLHSSI